MTISIKPRGDWKPIPGTHTRVTVLSQIARQVERAIRCSRSSPDNARDARESADEFVREFLPRGSGFDSGTSIDWDRSKPNRIVFYTEFHHMDDSGYCGWTEHTVKVVPNFVYDFNMSIGGRDRNDIRDYIGDVFRECLDDRISLVPDDLNPGTYVWSSDWSRAEKLRRSREDFAKRMAGTDSPDPQYWQVAQREACRRAIAEHMNEHRRMTLANGQTAVLHYSGNYVIEYADGAVQDASYRSMDALLWAVGFNRK